MSEHRDFADMLTAIEEFDRRIQAYMMDRLTAYGTYLCLIAGEAKLESEIERLLYLALCEEAGNRVQTENGGLLIHPQAEIDTLDGTWRADFLLRGALGDTVVTLVVEADSHEWHERTKEQARKDKFRDRSLQAAGYTVLHFAGSEIWAMPDRCACQVMDHYDRLLGLTHGRAVKVVPIK